MRGEGMAKEVEKAAPAGEKKGGGLKRALKELVYGMAVHDMVRYALKTRMYLEHLFMLITLGDMLAYRSCRPTTP